MEISYLHEFEILCDYMNFSVASSVLGISKDLLSRHITAMEKELGDTLFVRTTRSVSLTPVGNALLPYARRITSGYSDFLQYKEHVFGNRLVIGSFHSMKPTGITELIDHYAQMHPELNLHYIERSGRFLYEYMDRGECSASFLLLYRQDLEAALEKYRVQQLKKINNVVLLPKSHPMASHSELHLTDLSGETPVNFPNVYKTLLNMKESSIARVIENTAAWVNAGMGISVLIEPEALAQASDYPELCTIPLVGCEQPTLCLVSPLETTSIAAEQFISYVRDSYPTD